MGISVHFIAILSSVSCQKDCSPGQQIFQHSYYLMQRCWNNVAMKRRIEFNVGVKQSELLWNIVLKAMLVLPVWVKLNKHPYRTEASHGLFFLQQKDLHL